MPASRAIAELAAADADTFPEAGDGRPCAVTSSPAVPVEIVRAAGLRPLVVRGARDATPAADAHLERDVFPHRLRRLVDAVLTGRLDHATCIILPRTSDADYKCFLYLREFARQRASLPPVLLYDLVQSDGAAVRSYNTARTRALLGALACLSGHPASDGDVHRELARTRGARAAARRIASLRLVYPRVSGTVAFHLLSAFRQLDPEHYAAMANRAADELATWARRDGPRILLAGAPADTAALHEAIESHGGTVIAETGMWGAGVACDDPAEDGDPVAAVAESYRTNAIGARTPLREARAHTERLLHNVDAVVVSLPPDDAVIGWGYPALRDLLDDRGIPHTRLRIDPCELLGPADHAALDALMAVASAICEQPRHG